MQILVNYLHNLNKTNFLIKGFVLGLSLKHMCERLFRNNLFWEKWRGQKGFLDLDFQEMVTWKLGPQAALRRLAMKSYQNLSFKLCGSAELAIYYGAWSTADVTSSDVLQENASSIGWNVNVDDVISGVGKEKLWNNTEEALSRGAFGVPRWIMFNWHMTFKVCSTYMHLIC